MKMMYCHYHYEKSKHPKFYDAACELLKNGYKSAFTSQNEVDIFVQMVKTVLDEHKPEGHASKVIHSKGADGGQITIWTGSLDDDIARLYYYPISRFLEYDLDAQDFFDVSERYEKGGNV